MASILDELWEERVAEEAKAIQAGADAAGVSPEQWVEIRGAIYEGNVEAAQAMHAKAVGGGKKPPKPKKPTYRSSPTSEPKRRTKADIQQLCTTIYELVEAEQPMTVRQIYYRLVSCGAIGKTEGEYKQTVCRLLTDMRRRGDLPYGWIADNTRWQRKPDTYSSMEEMLRITQETYRRAIWDNQDAEVEIWLEKDALSGVLYDVTAEWDVPLMVTRGYPSLTFLHSSAEAMSTTKPTYIYYFGDHDPSGVDIPRKVERDLRAFAPEAEIHFERVAVTVEQIKEYDLPTRPTKKSDSRAKSFEGESVEVDAIPPTELRNLVRKYITSHIDHRSLRTLRMVEDMERDTLAGIINGLEGDD